MGTNYYAIPKVTDELKSSIKKAIDSNNFVAARELMPKRIHIGKSSGGWQFLFNHNDWFYFEPNQKSVANFINRCQIVNEYGDEVTPNQFWVMVDTKRDGKPEGEYGKIVDGLNFSNFTDFS